MGLASALSTALTGLRAAETTIDVVGNNLANSNTAGFKSSTASFASQFLQTQSLGSAPTDSNGGTNTRQLGLGTMVADITPNFNQGTIEISANPSDMAIQGEGFFMVESQGGEQAYTRNGNFKMNSENQLVTVTGNRLLGWGVDDQFDIQEVLTTVEIPLGGKNVAQPTQNVYLEGSLTPTGDVANKAEILESSVLGDAQYSAPPNTATLGLSLPPNVVLTAATGQAGAGALTALGTYNYRVVFSDDPLPPPPQLVDTEGPASAAIGPVTLGAGENEILLNNVPVDAGGTYSTRRLYRTIDGGATYQFVAEIPDNVTTTYTDGVSDAVCAASTALDDDTITGNYSYYVTFANAPGGPGIGVESRPTSVIGPLNAANARIQLRDLPVDASGQWSVRRIYRNLATDDSVFHYVGEISDVLTANLTYTDNASDLTIQANDQLDFDGPKITSSTLLTDVLRRDGTTYDSAFDIGTLTLTGRKGGRELSGKDLEITATSTVLEILSFMEEAFGIVKPPGPDAANPVPGDISGVNPGGSVLTSGKIRLVGNNGTANELDIGLSAMQLTTATGTDSTNVAFGSIQSAVGESTVADFIAYDSLGIPLDVRLTSVLESRTSTSTTYRWFADSADNDPLAGVEINVGTGLITFDGEGNFISSTEETVSVDRRNVSSASPLEFELDFASLSGLAAEKATMAVSRQDGSAPGVLTSFIVSENGAIRGVFSNGVTRDLGQIRLVRFANSAGLVQQGENLFSAGVNSGLPVEGNPGEQGIGTLIAGAIELSNTDIGSNLIDLILASTMYRGNSRVISTAQQMLDELLNMRR